MVGVFLTADPEGKDLTQEVNQDFLQEKEGSETKWQRHINER